MKKNLEKEKTLKAVDEWGDEGKWATIVDFTKIRKGGVAAEEVIHVLKQLKKV